MDSKHGQIGQSRGGNREKKISESEPGCQPPPAVLHISQFVQLLPGGEKEGRVGGPPGGEVLTRALARLRVITGQDVTGGLTVSHRCILCPIEGFVGRDQIVLIREVNLSSSSPGCRLLQQPDGGIQLSRDHQFYYEVQLALEVTGRRSCYLVITTSRDLHYQVVAWDQQLWATVIQPTLNTCTM